MPLTITNYVTKFRTMYIPSVIGVISKYYTVVEDVDEEGNRILVTRVVSVVTVPFQPRGKTVVVPTKGLEKSLKYVATRGTYMRKRVRPA